ncbi:Aste57867_19968 [Aphanomyces stellatus]|uniref:Aste57867_19968 protein n=1 Tax=Aphanomyces stellatus TaxID=120398 RepID=A0A485LII5_9STRA|nr:hypothetical protein As57867_019902 [Aphanomyces stellatus]VFT96665.1 Aste57867_19968 [Aphanomyces stellatus]
MRRGAPPRDFVSENRKLVKQKQRDVQKQKELDEEKERERRERESFKLKKFTGTGSRAGSSLGDASSDSRSMKSSHSTRSLDDRLTKARVPTLAELKQREEELKELVTRNKNVDYISTNAWHVIQQAPKRAEPTPSEIRDAEARRHRSFGEVPAYIRARKAAWAKEEEERRMNLPDPDCPPGMILMPEEERLATLATLRDNYEQARRQMQALPLRIETLSQIRRKNAVEAQMMEIEDAIKVFDKPKVFMLPATSSA